MAPFWRPGSRSALGTRSISICRSSGSSSSKPAAIRRAGSAALDLAMVAAGVYDGFFEFRLSVWDIAAGALLIEEAGGRLTDFSGGTRFWERGNVVAGSPAVTDGILKTVSRILTEEQI